MRMWRKQPLRKPFKEYIDMKIKLKKGEVVPRANDFSGLSKKDWNAINAGKSLELEVLPRALKPYVEEMKTIKEK